jgi:hypothetical protein
MPDVKKTSTEPLSSDDYNARKLTILTQKRELKAFYGKHVLPYKDKLELITDAKERSLRMAHQLEYTKRRSKLLQEETELEQQKPLEADQGTLILLQDDYRL